jgi:hypothetical protein
MMSDTTHVLALIGSVATLTQKVNFIINGSASMFPLPGWVIINNQLLSSLCTTAVFIQQTHRTGI